MEPRVLAAQAYGPDDPASIGDAEDRFAVFGLEGGVAGDPFGRRAIRIGMGNARGHARDRPKAHMALDGLGIFRPEGPQQQPLACDLFALNTPGHGSLA